MGGASSTLTARNRARAISKAKADKLAAAYNAEASPESSSPAVNEVVTRPPIRPIQPTVPSQITEAQENQNQGQNPGKESGSRTINLVGTFTPKGAKGQGLGGNRGPIRQLPAGRHGFDNFREKETEKKKRKLFSGSGV